MVPEGWERLPLERVAEIRSGVAKGKKNLKDPVRLPYLRVANVQDGHVVLDDIKEIEIEKSKIDRYSLKKGDVLMNEGGDFDKLGRGDVWLGQIEPCLHQNHVFAVRPNPNIIDSFYLAALAASNYGKTYFLGCAKRSTNLASINSTQLKGFPVLVPPLQEQKKMAQLLSTWDKAITTTEQLLANSQQQKKALMQQLLTGKKRLLDENGVRFSGEWSRYKLKDIGNTFSGLTGKSKADFGKGTPYIPYKNIFKNSRTDLNELDYVEVNEGENQSAVKFGDIFFTTSSEVIEEVGMSSVLIDDVETLYLNSFCFGFRLNDFETLTPQFAQHLFRSESSRRKISKLGQGATRYNLSKKQLTTRFEFKVPPINEQIKIASVLSNADNVTAQLSKQLVRLKYEKKALMQQLLTGKRRVKLDKEAT